MGILNKHGNVSVQVNKLKNRVKSTIECQDGSVVAQINPEISVSLELDSGGALNMNTRNFHERTRISPTITRGDLEAATPNVKNKGRSTLISGKIDLISAQKYALHAERFGSSGDENQVSTDDQMGEMSGSKDNPYLSITTPKDVTIKTLSWMDAIKDKFGFLEEEQEHGAK